MTHKIRYAPVLLIALTLSCAGTARTQVASREYFVSPDGSETGDGSRENPWDLATALRQPSGVAPGDTIWLRGGTYGDSSGLTEFKSYLKGTVERPITVRQFPHERATILGILYIYGESTWYWGFEITSTVTDRSGDTNGASKNFNSLDCYAPNTRLINLVVHDTRQGLGMWSEAPDSEAYGNIIYFNGYQASDRGHGHGIYVQNNDGSKRLEDNILFDQFGVGIHAYATSNGYVRNITAEGNIAFSNGGLSAKQAFDDNILFAADGGLENIVIRDNYTFHPAVNPVGYSRVGWQFSPANRNVIVKGNYWIGGYISLLVYRWSQVSLTQNTFYSDGSYAMMLDLLPEQDTSAYEWNQNTYYGTGKWFYRGKETSEWDTWRQWSGLDQNSIRNASKPTGAWTIVRPNKYEPGRANIAIYNWELSDTVDVDVSAVLKDGDAWELRDAQNYFGTPVATGTYRGKPIRVPMKNLRVATPLGCVPTLPVHTAPQFGAFILLPVETTNDSVQ